MLGWPKNPVSHAYYCNFLIPSRAMVSIMADRGYRFRSIEKECKVRGAFKKTVNERIFPDCVELRLYGNLDNVGFALNHLKDDLRIRHMNVEPSSAQMEALKVHIQ